MIITRTPLRITLGGGGTDLKPYYSKYGGFVITAAIDRYVYLAVNKMFEDKIRLSYSKTEIVDSFREIDHPVVREALGMLGMERNLEIVSIADMPSNTGLGSSGSFAVGLLNALHTLGRQPVRSDVLAEEACKIQMEILREPEGKQDPYIAALGGIATLSIEKNGRVTARHVRLKAETLEVLQDSLQFFYTGIKRRSTTVLAGQSAAIEKDDEKVLNSVHRIKEIGIQVLSALEKGDISEFGRLQHEHWLAKRSVSPAVSSSKIDSWYTLGVRAGALGGKILGAGGGGFIMFCNPGDKTRVRKVMAQEGLREVMFNLGAGGSKVVANL